MKKFAALICGTVFALSSACSATIATDKIALDRVTPGMKVAELIQIYGQPINRHDDDWIYQNFKVEIDDDWPDIVEAVQTRSGAVATPDGVTVGQSVDVLSRVYGQADKVDNDRHKTDYEYFSGDRSKLIEFTVANGIITKIKCKVRD